MPQAHAGADADAEIYRFQKLVKLQGCLGKAGGLDDPFEAVVGEGGIPKPPEQPWTSIITATPTTAAQEAWLGA